MTLSLLILGGLIFVIAIIVVFFLFSKHSQYMKEATNKLKVYILPETGAMEIKVISIDFSRHVISIPDGENMPRYFFNKENTWTSRYPNDPFLGMTWLCVPIASAIYFKGNPEPATSHPLEPLVTSYSIAAAIDEEFELVLKKISATMLALEKRLTEALTHHLNKGVVYIALVIILLMVCINLYFSYVANQHVTQVLNAFGLR